MEIKRKLTFQFIGIVAAILLVASLSIYISFSTSRKEEFYGRLESKAKLVSQMLFDIDEIDAELLRRIEKNNPLSLPNELIAIFDFQNTVLFSSDDYSILRVDSVLLNKVRLSGEIRYKIGDYEVLGKFYTGQYDRIVVFASAEDIFGMNKLRMLRFILLTVFVLSLAVVYVAGRIFSTRALMPVSRIISDVSDIEATKLDQRISEGNGKDELAVLSKTFNLLLERIEKAFKVQKTFIANASHELRTPLTSVSGNLEVALMKDRQPDEYRKIINSVLEDIRRLSSLSDKLLTLAQSDSIIAHNEKSLIRMDDLLWQSRKEIISSFPSYIVNIHFHNEIDDESKLTVLGNETLLKTAMTNLIENACKYSPDRTAEVIISWQYDFLVIEIKDNGIGIPKDEIDKVFEPFQRASNSIGYSGHGLGLSMAMRIIIQHKGTLTTKSEKDKGSCFTVKLPSIPVTD